MRLKDERKLRITFYTRVNKFFVGLLLPPHPHPPPFYETFLFIGLALVGKDIVFRFIYRV